MDDSTITFLIMSSLNLPWRTHAINNTWKRTIGDNDIMYFSESNTTYYGAQKDQYNLLSIHKAHTKWTCLIDDDTYVNIMRMRQMLQQYNASMPLLIGHVLVPYKCLWGGAGMILSHKAHDIITSAIRSGKIQAPSKMDRNDVEIVKWARQLGISIIHSNLMWGDSVPESEAFFFNQIGRRREHISSAIQGAVTLHKMCKIRTCHEMYETMRLVQNTYFFSI